MHMTTPERFLPKYCPQKPSGRAYMRIRGRVHYLGAHGSPKSREFYERLIAGLLDQHTSTAPHPPSGEITVVQVASA